MSTAKIHAIRGMNDILPDEITYWQFLEKQIYDLATSYGYQEIRMPILEKTKLFNRSIGEITDIVEKEMFTFLDRDNESITLRPECTASCVRAAVEHGMVYNQTQKLWYLGPSFRYERPQKGRYRQFYQFGVEVFGIPGPDIDAEIIFMSAKLWQLLSIADAASLQINSLGTLESRAKYREKLVEYFSQHEEFLDEENQRRLTLNPLRILDSKEPAMQAIIANAPQLTDFLDPISEDHFQRFKEYLTAANIAFTVNPRLVRGLDYYTGIVFEWVTTDLGAQGTICAGGRYDGLVAELGGNATPAVGFALGCERVIELMRTRNVTPPISDLDAYLIVVGEVAQSKGLLIAESLRKEIPTLRLLSHCGGGSFKNQFKRADKSGARIALIIGDEEIAANTIGIKFLREHREQISVPMANIAEFLPSALT